MTVLEQIHSKIDLLTEIKNRNYDVYVMGNGYALEECPFCSGHDCFRIYQNDNKWSCFQCTDNKTNQDVIDFIGYSNGTELSETIRKLIVELNIYVDSETDDTIEVEKVKRLALSYYQKTFLKYIDQKKALRVLDLDGKKIRKSLKEHLHKHRGLNTDFLLSMGVGYSDGMLAPYLLEVLKIPEAYVVKSGLIKTNTGDDYFAANSMIFSHTTAHGFSHFSSDKGLAKQNIALKQAASHVTANSLFYLQETIPTRHEIEAVFVCEGQYDALSIYQVTENLNPNIGVLATTGKISAKQIEFLKDMHAPAIYMFFDGDDPGKAMRNTLIEHLPTNVLKDIPADIFGENDINYLLTIADDPKITLTDLIKEAIEPKLYKITKAKQEERFFEPNEDELYDTELEQSIIKTMFIESDFSVLTTISEKAFYVSSHRKIQQRMLKLLGEGREPDMLVTITEAGVPKTVLENIKEASEIDLVEGVRLLVWYHERRAINSFSTELNSLVSQKTDLKYLRDQFSTAIHDAIITSHDTSDDVYTPENIVEKAAEDIPDEGIQAVKSGFSNLDPRLVYGFYSGTMTIIAGSPGAGKSMFKTNVQRNQCEYLNYGVISYTPENGLIMDQARMDSLMLGIPFMEILRASKSSEIYELRKKNWEKLSKWNFVQSGEIVGIPKIVTDVILYKRKYPRVKEWIVYVDLADYIKEFAAGGANRWLNIEESLRLLRNLGKPKNLDFAVVLLAHIGRSGKSKKSRNKEDRKPTMDSLRGSAGYENVSDLVFLLYRDRMFDPSTVDDLLEVNMAKQRGGVSNVHILFEFIPEFSKVEPTENDVYEDGDMSSDDVEEESPNSYL